MGKGRVINTDLDFIRTIKKAGGDDLKKCYQCATCATVCELSPDSKPFPRKEMILAGWGQSDKLIGDPDIWLCYQCNDCATYCPRGAKPGNVLAAIRSYIYEHYSFPSFMGKALASPKALPLLWAVPIVVITALVLIFNGGDFSFVNDGKIVFSKFLSHFWIEIFFIPATHLVGLFALIGLYKYWKALEATSPEKKMGFVPGAILVVKDILTHINFFSCDTNKSRGLMHLLIFFGFIGAAVTTGIGIFMMYILHIDPPFSLMNHPVKWLGNASAIAGILGCGYLIIRKAIEGDKVGATGYQDWLFLIVMFATFLTGFMAQMLRVADLAVLAYATYYVHLIVVFFLLIYAPYSKFAHMLYRTVALIHAKCAGRESVSCASSN
ncbi:quinone-interacting membrane-bound oxidoreductase complex subunit QmoC [Elusimicrobiota bacterium]